MLNSKSDRIAFLYSGLRNRLVVITEGVGMKPLIVLFPRHVVRAKGRWDEAGNEEGNV